MNIKKVSEKVIHDNGYWKYKHDLYQLETGDTIDYYYGEHTGSVAIIPVTADGQIVLVNQYRYLFNKHSLELPAGGVHEDETPTQAAARELLEETGFVADNLIKVGTFEPANGSVRSEAHVFLTNVSRQQEHQREIGEQIEVTFRSPEEIDHLIRQNRIWDGYTLAAWTLTRHLLKKEEETKTESPTIGGIIKELIGE